MWRCIFGCVVHQGYKDRSAFFIFNSQAVNLCWTASPLKINSLRSFETSETTHPTTKRHIPEDLNNTI